MVFYRINCGAMANLYTQTVKYVMYSRLYSSIAILYVQD